MGLLSSRYYFYYWAKDNLEKYHNSYYRKLPVPGVHKRCWRGCMRHPRTTQEKRLNESQLCFIRGKRTANNLPFISPRGKRKPKNLVSIWDDIWRSTIYDKCWKRNKKKKQWMRGRMNISDKY